MKRWQLWTLLWTQIASYFGSGMTAFAVSLWAFESHQTVSSVSSTLLFRVIPELCVLPFVGSLVDRWSRTRALIIGEAGCAAAAVGLLASSFFGQAYMPWICGMLFLDGLFSAFHWPALNALVSDTLASHDRGKAAAFHQFGETGAFLLAPAAAGLFYETLGIRGVLFFDIGSFVFSVACLGLIPATLLKTDAKIAAPKNIWIVKDDFRLGWAFIKNTHPLLLVLCVFFSINVCQGAITATRLPFLLQYNGERVASILAACVGGGLTLGNALGAYLRPRASNAGALGWLTLVFAVGNLSAALLGRHSIALGAAFTIAMTAFGLGGTLSQAMWLELTPTNIQGRVFAVRRFLAKLGTPLALLVTGPVVDHFFNRDKGTTARIDWPGLNDGYALFIFLAGSLQCVCAVLLMSGLRKGRIGTEARSL